MLQCLFEDMSCHNAFVLHLASISLGLSVLLRSSVVRSIMGQWTIVLRMYLLYNPGCFCLQCHCKTLFCLFLSTCVVQGVLVLWTSCVVTVQIKFIHPSFRILQICTEVKVMNDKKNYFYCLCSVARFKKTYSQISQQKSSQKLVKISKTLPKVATSATQRKTLKSTKKCSLSVP